MDKRACSATLLCWVLVVAACCNVAAHSGHLEHGGRRKLAQLPGGLPDGGVWSGFRSLLGLSLGDSAPGLSDLKKYLVQFGYLDPADSDSQVFDNPMLTAVQLYQKSFRLSVTGVLDVKTLAQMMMPRCGREDVANGTALMLETLGELPPPQPANAPSPSAPAPGASAGGTSRRLLNWGVSRYAFFPGRPKWRSKSRLTYAFQVQNETTQVTKLQREEAFFNAFTAWAAVVPITFTQIQDYNQADITIQFAYLDHGDGEPFDGELGVLAHAFSPEDGRFHLDNAELWTVDVKASTSPYNIDLQSVALHEIGHLLGLGHSGDQNAIMFPSISPQEAKQVLMSDDIAGAQALYGANPNYDPNAPLPTFDPNNQAVGKNGAQTLLSHCTLVSASVATFFATVTLLWR